MTRMCAFFLMKWIYVLIACRIYKKTFKIFRKSLVKAIQLSEIGEIPCLYLPKSLAIEGAKSALGLHHLTLRVQVQPQKNTKCRPCDRTNIWHSRRFPHELSYDITSDRPNLTELLIFVGELRAKLNL